MKPIRSQLGVGSWALRPFLSQERPAAMAFVLVGQPSVILSATLARHADDAFAISMRQLKDCDRTIGVRSQSGQRIQEEAQAADSISRSTAAGWEIIGR